MKKNSGRREKTQLKFQKTQVSAILQEIQRQKSVQKKACFNPGFFFPIFWIPRGTKDLERTEFSENFLEFSSKIA